MGIVPSPRGGGRRRPRPHSAPERVDHLTAPGPPPAVPDGVDRNGCPVEVKQIGGEQVIVHYDDIPDSDRTTVHGIPCTTAVRTVIDIAPELAELDLDEVILHALDRRLFTVEEMLIRIAAPDMATRPGPDLIRDALRRLDLAA